MVLQDMFMLTGNYNVSACEGPGTNCWTALLDNSPSYLVLAKVNCLCCFLYQVADQYACNCSIACSANTVMQFD